MTSQSDMKPDMTFIHVPKMAPLLHTLTLWHASMSSLNSTVSKMSDQQRSDGIDVMQINPYKNASVFTFQTIKNPVTDISSDKRIVLNTVIFKHWFSFSFTCFHVSDLLLLHVLYRPYICQSAGMLCQYRHLPLKNTISIDLYTHSMN